MTLLSQYPSQLASQKVNQSVIRSVWLSDCLCYRPSYGQSANYFGKSVSHSELDTQPMRQVIGWEIVLYGIRMENKIALHLVENHLKSWEAHERSFHQNKVTVRT